MSAAERIPLPQDAVQYGDDFLSARGGMERNLIQCRKAMHRGFATKTILLPQELAEHHGDDFLRARAGMERDLMQYRYRLVREPSSNAQEHTVFTPCDVKPK